MDTSQHLQQHLAAIVEGSDDAIITKNLDSIVTSWNRGAECLFGYSAEEAIGQPITMIFPEDRKGEEADLIERLSRGERISHYETIRRRKDGSLVPISLTVSPVRDSDGSVVGASKIARDISQRREAEEQQRMLLSEMRHRVANCFAVAGGLLGLCARQSETVEDLVLSMRERFQALATAHSLAVLDPAQENGIPEDVTLSDLLESILKPFAGETPHQLDVENTPVTSAAITTLALVFYELATNAVKYGGLSRSDGRLSIYAAHRDDRLRVIWTETSALGRGNSADHHQGFGTRMIRSTVATYFDGSFQKVLSPSGMTVTLDLSLDKVTGSQFSAKSPSEADNSTEKRRARKNQSVTEAANSSMPSARRLTDSSRRPT